MDQWTDGRTDRDAGMDGRMEVALYRDARHIQEPKDEISDRNYRSEA